MAHFSIEGLRERFKDGGAGAETTTESAEEFTQPLGGDDGDSVGESGGSSGADTKQADADNHVAGLGTAKSEAEPKSRAK